MIAPFEPRWPWLGADLQTLRNFIVRPALPAVAADRLELAMRDGSGDRLVAFVDRASDSGRTTALLVHGLTGCSESSYILATAARLRAAGHRIVRLNLRGAPPGRAVAGGHYHAGRSTDLADALAALPAKLTADGVAAVGFSLGANLMLKYLGEAGAGSAIRIAASVSAPIDLLASSRRFGAWRNAVYQRHLLRRMKREATAPGARLSESERRAIADAGDVLAFDDRFTAPRHGFADAFDYYARCSAEGLLASIRTPTLVIHALDDPWIPGDAYLRTDWAANDRLVPLLPARGGHVGFHGRGDPIAWHDRAIERFFAAAGEGPRRATS